MGNYVLLNNVEHSDLKVRQHFFEKAGDTSAAVLTFPTEFVEIQREYPILLKKKTDEEDYQAVALLGLANGENLFLEKEVDTDSEGVYKWSGGYVPAALARGPFMIGFQAQDGKRVPVVYVDVDSPKVCQDQGQALFLSQGGNSSYLDYIIQVLGAIQNGIEVGPAMYRAFDELGLIESLDINIDLGNGERVKLSGYFTINESRLASLDGNALESLNKSGYLQGAFLILSSLSNIQRLIKIKNTRSE